MTTLPYNFAGDRLEAVRSFAQTMIVVDDEAELTVREEQVPNEIFRPTRAHSKAIADRDPGTKTVADIDRTHRLDGKTLIDSAMDLGLVCSILRPRRGEDLRDRIAQAAQRVDIICLDWTIHGDDGAAALSLIKGIVQADQQRNGRLRLIVIYTGERSRGRILDRVKKEVISSFSKVEEPRMRLRKLGGREIRSNIGLKVVCLIKAHDAGIPAGLSADQVSEKDLPARLLDEFSGLSEGLLSNVALGTIAAIRDAAHQVVGSFGGDLDGPYFHHRAILSIPDEAEDYAINVVLEALRTAVRLREVGQRYSGTTAIGNRIKFLAKTDENLLLSYKFGKNNIIGATEVCVDDVIRLVCEGIEEIYDSVDLKEKPAKSQFKRWLTSFFAGDHATTRDVMKAFAALVGTGSHPGTYNVRADGYIPSLTLGTVVRERSGNYWLCLQASCDSVRVKEDRPFLFVPLVEVAEGGRFVIPAKISGNRIDHVALDVEEYGYAKARSIVFEPDPNTRRVLASPLGRPKRLRFQSKNRRTFEWMADLKHYHALNVALQLSQQMSRLGVDVFEPFRNAGVR